MVTNVAVTGSSGFIGGAIFKALSVDKNFYVKKILRSGDSFLCNEYFDVIVHCAEISDRKLVNELGEIYQTNIISNLGQLVSKCKYLIYLSSSALYDSSSSDPKTESSKIKIDDNYCASKIASENIVLSSGGVSLRVSNVYGNEMSRSNVISDIFSQLGSEIMTLNNIYAVRDFIHVEDVASYVKELIMINNYKGLLNIGSGVGWSIKNIAEYANAAYGSPETRLISKAQPNLNSIILSINNLHNICTYRAVNNIQNFILNKISNM